MYGSIRYNSSDTAWFGILEAGELFWLFLFVFGNHILDRFPFVTIAVICMLILMIFIDLPLVFSRARNQNAVDTIFVTFGKLTELYLNTLRTLSFIVAATLGAETVATIIGSFLHLSSKHSLVLSLVVIGFLCIGESCLVSMSRLILQLSSLMIVPGILLAIASTFFMLFGTSASSELHMASTLLLLPMVISAFPRLCILLSKLSGDQFLPELFQLSSVPGHTSNTIATIFFGVTVMGSTVLFHGNLNRLVSLYAISILLPLAIRQLTFASTEANLFIRCLEKLLHGIVAVTAVAVAVGMTLEMKFTSTWLEIVFILILLFLFVMLLVRKYYQEIEIELELTPDELRTASEQSSLLDSHFSSSQYRTDENYSIVFINAWNPAALSAIHYAAQIASQDSISVYIFISVTETQTNNSKSLEEILHHESDKVIRVTYVYLDHSNQNVLCFMNEIIDVRRRNLNPSDIITVILPHTFGDCSWNELTHKQITDAVCSDIHNSHNITVVIAPAHASTGDAALMEFLKRGATYAKRK